MWFAVSRTRTLKRFLGQTAVFAQLDHGGRFSKYSTLLFSRTEKNNSFFSFLSLLVWHRLVCMMFVVCTWPHVLKQQQQDGRMAEKPNGANARRTGRSFYMCISSLPALRTRGVTLHLSTLYSGVVFTSNSASLSVQTHSSSRTVLSLFLLSRLFFFSLTAFFSFFFLRILIGQVSAHF